MRNQAETLPHKAWTTHRIEDAPAMSARPAACRIAKPASSHMRLTGVTDYGWTVRLFSAADNMTASITRCVDKAISGQCDSRRPLETIPENRRNILAS